MEFITEWITFNYHYLFIVAAIIIFSCIYFLAKRIVLLCVNRGNEHLLSFIVGSLLFLNLFFFILMVGNQEAQAITFIPYLLQILGLFGLLLIFVHGIKYAYRRLASKKT